ncbi:MAG TPA: hypothetical protein VJI70_03330 [Candidatus Paceibacterota bacterium]
MSLTLAEYQKARYELANALWDVGAVLTAASAHPLVIKRGKERGFKLKLHEKNPDAPLSPFYLNLRTQDNPKPGPLTPQVVEQAARCMQGILGNVRSFDAVVGVPRAGDPFAKAFAILADKPFVAMEKYEHDGVRRIASLKGKVPASVKKALLADDLITGADSKVEAVLVLQDEGIAVDDVIVLVDREQGGPDQLMEWGCHLHSVFTITELLDFFVAENKMKSELRDEIHAYLAA